MTVAATPFIGPRLLLRRGRWEEVREWFPTGRHVLLASGRQALYQGLLALGVRPGDRVLTPSFVCESVVRAVEQAGARPVFYIVRRDLTVDLDHVEAVARSESPAALLVIHYFGLPDPRFGDLVALASERGLPLVEDCAHALFGRLDGRPIGSSGAAAVFSLAKSLPTPGGGVLFASDCTEVTRPPRERGPLEARGMVKLVAYAVEARLPVSIRGRLLASPRVRDAVRSRNDERPARVNDAMGSFTYRILAASSPSDIVARRRRNFRRVVSGLEELVVHGIRPIREELPEGACPLGVPLVVERAREHLRGWLYRRGLLLPAMWDTLPRNVAPDRFPDASYLRDHILLAPVHQGLRDRDMDRLVEALAEWSRR